MVLWRMLLGYLNSRYLTSMNRDELFYQLGLRQFGKFGRLRLDPPAPLHRLIALAVENEDGIEKSGLQKDQVVDVRLRHQLTTNGASQHYQTIFSIITARREMLSEYFSVSINDANEIETLPLLLRDYTPNLDKLPLFLMRLGPQVRDMFHRISNGLHCRIKVNWTDERECFDTFLRELAFFYVPGPLVPDTTNAEDQSQEEKSERWQIQHVVFPAMRKYLNAPKTLLDRDVVQVASLPDLYKVFERC